MRVSAKWRLADFDATGYDRGRPRRAQIAWFVVQHVAFAKWWLPARLRPPLLRLFGAKIGERVLIRHGVRVLWPWKLTVGNDVWIGEGAWLYTMEPIRIGHDVCVSQEAFLCTGSHDPYDVTFAYRNAPIDVADGSWIATQALVLPGARIPAGTVVPARARVTRATYPSSGRSVHGDGAA